MKSIRDILILLLSGLILVSCGASYQESKARRSAEKEAERQSIIKALTNADFTLDVTRIIPKGYPSRESTGEYSLRLKNSEVTTRLPFIGDSYAASFGNDEISIVFNKEKVTLITDFSDAASKGEYRYRFAGGEGPNKWTVDLQIYDNGSALIGCSGTGSRYISFYANLVMPNENDEN